MSTLTPAAGPGPAAATERSTAVVTGIGVMSPTGVDLETVWSAALTGRSAIGPLTDVDTDGYSGRLAGQVSAFDDAQVPKRLLPQTDRMTRMALVATERALSDAGADPTQLDEFSMGVVTSNAAGGFEFTHRELHKMWSQGPEYVSVFESFAWFYAVNTGQISIRHGMRGPSAALVGEQAGGLDAIGHARREIREGTPVVISGGTDSALDPWGWAGHQSTGRVTPQGDPAIGYRPFDVEADGYVPGEGGAILVLEDAATVGQRSVYGEIAGYAATFDPPPGSPRPPALRRAIELALADAGVTPEEVDVVFADAAGLPDADRQECEALTAVFGVRGVPVTAPKTLTGRLLGGGGPLDVVLALMAVRDGLVPPTVGTTSVPQEYGIDLVLGAPRALPVRCALVLARGRHGFNSAVVVRAVRDPTTAPPDHPQTR